MGSGEEMQARGWRRAPCGCWWCCWCVLPQLAWEELAWEAGAGVEDEREVVAFAVWRVGLGVPHADDWPNDPPSCRDALPPMVGSRSIYGASNLSLKCSVSSCGLGPLL